MIIYSKNYMGLRTITRVHGSAVYKAVIPALCSTMILLFTVFIRGFDIADNDIIRVTKDPYVITVLVSFFTFLITFRANFAYGRYWEGASDVNVMLSKWIDVGMALAAYHMQSSQYDSIRPPALGTQDGNRHNLSRERERVGRAKTIRQYETQLNTAIENSAKNEGGILNFLKSQRVKKSTSIVRSSSIFRKGNPRPLEDLSDRDNIGKSITAVNTTSSYVASLGHKKRNKSLVSSPKLSECRLNGGIETQETSLFLQEAAHLLSLLSAVAMSTLRHDLEGTELPLTTFIPGEMWPPVDPDELCLEVRDEYDDTNVIWRAAFFVFGISRSDQSRTLYNAARPFRVIGGISDEEARCLRAARGPYAKVSLCTMWLQEFISRESMKGSTGKMGRPILSRLYHFISDGMVGYNQSRKIAYVDFPFPSAQLTILFILVIIFVFPLLHFSYVNNLPFACVLNFSTVACFVGLHEVARELESPFHNVPNDIPLTTFQAEFNEALCAMFAGFHPDSWWDPPAPIPQPLIQEVETENTRE